MPLELPDVQLKAPETLSEGGIAVRPDTETTPKEEAPADQMMSQNLKSSFNDEIFEGGKEETKLTKGEKWRNDAQRTARPIQVRSHDNVLNINRDT